MNARTLTQVSAARLQLFRNERRMIYCVGGISEQELYDELNFILSQCDDRDEVQREVRDQLSTICADMETDEPDADAFRGYVAPSVLDSRLERP